MKKDILIPIIVFIIIFILFIGIYLIINNKSNKYSCYDYENDITYTFKTEEEMHEVCDKFTGEKDDQLLNSYTIYNDLLNVDDSSFAFYPYINSNEELSIIITITDCDNPEQAKEKAINWFNNHSYNINDYTVEYEYPCTE